MNKKLFEDIADDCDEEELTDFDGLPYEENQTEDDLFGDFEDGNNKENYYDDTLPDEDDDDPSLEDDYRKLEDTPLEDDEF